MIATIITIGIAFYWLGIETNWLTVRLPYGKSLLVVEPEPQAVKILATSKPMLALPVGNPDNYPMTLTIDTTILRGLIAQLSKTELELTEEYYA